MLFHIFAYSPKFFNYNLSNNIHTDFLFLLIPLCIHIKMWNDIEYRGTFLRNSRLCSFNENVYSKEEKSMLFINVKIKVER